MSLRFFSYCPDPDCGCLLACQCALCVDGDA